MTAPRDGDADLWYGHRAERGERAAQRREEIVQLLRTSGEPIHAADLAHRLGVSRQSVGHDVAVVRAAGLDISATPRGYLIRGGVPAGQHDVLQVQHDRAAIVEELHVLVDRGLRVHDECVEHPVLGHLCGPLSIATRQEARAYAERLEQTGSAPLLELTGGRHSHTVEVPRAEVLTEARRELRHRGYLVEDRPRKGAR